MSTSDWLVQLFAFHEKFIKKSSIYEENKVLMKINFTVKGINKIRYQQMQLNLFKKKKNATIQVLIILKTPRNKTSYTINMCSEVTIRM